MTWCRSLLQVLDNAIEAEKIIQRYEALASDLLEWIEKTINIISNQKFANSLTGVQQQLQAFTTYCTIEKPIKYMSISFSTQWTTFEIIIVLTSHVNFYHYALNYQLVWTITIGSSICPINCSPTLSLLSSLNTHFVFIMSVLC